MRRLILRPGAIGDCILSIPALEHLRATYTEVWISSAVVPLVALADTVRPLSSTGLDTVGVGDLEMPAGLKQRLQSFDSIVSWYGSNRPEFREALTRLGVPCEFHAALPPSGFEGHATDFFSEQVGAPAGLLPQIGVPTATSRGTIIMHPFSGSARKNWPLASYRELAGRLARPVEWTCGPEEELSGAVRFDCLHELAMWMAGAQAYIGNDSGITHLAAAIGLPTLAIFGPCSPNAWVPRGPNVRVLRATSLCDLRVDDVLEAVNRYLGK